MILSARSVGLLIATLMIGVGMIALGYLIDLNNVQPNDTVAPTIITPQPINFSPVGRAIEGSNANAEETASALQESNSKGSSGDVTLIVGLFGFVPPYAFGDPVQGADADRVHRILTKAGLSFTVISRSQPRLIRDFEEGRVDVRALHGIPPEGCIATEPFTFWRDSVVIRKSDREKYKKINDLIGERVGTYPQNIAGIMNGGVEGHEVFRTYDISLDNTSLGAYARLLKGRTEAFIGDINIIQFYHLLKQPQIDFPLMALHNLPPDYHRLCTRSEEVRDKINAAIASLPLLSQWAPF